MVKHALPLSIVIVTYNSTHVIEQCLESFSPGDYEVLIIDNASSDCEAMQEILTAFPSVRLIKNEQNLGFGAANNIGIAEALYDTILLVNPDLSINDKTIAALYESWDGASIVAPNIVAGKDGRSQQRIFGQRVTTETGMHQTDWVSGACYLFNRTCTPAFDERFFLFFEETDVMRCFQKQGGNICLNLTCCVEHASGTSTPPSDEVIYLKEFHSTRSKLLFYRKHYRLWRYCYVYLGLLIKMVKLYAFKTKKASSLVKAKAIWKALSS